MKPIKKRISRSTIINRRRDEILNAVACRLLNNPSATWGHVEKLLIIPSEKLGVSTEQQVLDELESKLKGLLVNISNNGLRHEYQPAADLKKIAQDYPLLPRGAASKNYKKGRR